MIKEQIFVISSLARICLHKIKGAKTKKYECTYQLETLTGKKHHVGNQISVGFFDTEEKGRMYIKALGEGIKMEDKIREILKRYNPSFTKPDGKVMGIIPDKLIDDATKENSNIISNDKGKDKPDSCHWQKWQELGSLIDDVLPGDKLPDSIFNAVKKMQKKLSNDKGEVIAEGKVVVREQFSGIRDIYVEGKKQCVFWDDLPNILLPLEGHNIKITITRGEIIV